VPFRDFVSANPYYAKRDENGEVYKVLESYQGVNGTTQHVYNPLWDFNQKSFDRSNDLNINNNFNVEYQPLAGLRLTGRFGFTAARGTSETFKSPFYKKSC